MINFLWRRNVEILLKGAVNQPTPLFFSCVSQTQEEITDHTVCHWLCESHSCTKFVFCTVLRAEPEGRKLIVPSVLCALTTNWKLSYCQTPDSPWTKCQEDLHRITPHHLSTPEVCYRFSCPPHTLNCSPLLRSLAVSREKRKQRCGSWTSPMMRSPSATTRSQRWAESSPELRTLCLYLYVDV